MWITAGPGSLCTVNCAVQENLTTVVAKSPRLLILLSLRSVKMTKEFCTCIFEKKNAALNVQEIHFNLTRDTLDWVFFQKDDHSGEILLYFTLLRQIIEPSCTNTIYATSSFLRSATNCSTVHVGYSNVFRQWYVRCKVNVVSFFLFKTNSSLLYLLHNDMQQ